MGREALYGCLGGFVAVLLTLGLGGYFFVYRPVQNVLGGFRSLSAPLTSGGQGQQLPSAPRADVRLGAAQVRQFVRVRRDVRDAVGQDFERLQNVYQGVANGDPPGTLKVLGVLREAGGFLSRAKGAQQRALLREGLSEGEYADVRAQVNRALGVPAFDLRAAARNLQSGRLPDWSEIVPPPNPHNSELIAPFLNELRDTAALGLLGL